MKMYFYGFSFIVNYNNPHRHTADLQSLRISCQKAEFMHHNMIDKLINPTETALL